MARHQNIKWVDVEKSLIRNSEKIWSIQQMELTGSELDVIAYDKKINHILFVIVHRIAQKIVAMIMYLLTITEQNPTMQLGAFAALFIYKQNETNYTLVQRMEKSLLVHWTISKTASIIHFQ